jgi:hypothetical protein
MVHHPQKNMKKLQIIRQIFRWFGLVLLSLLLIAAIFFQAPWKVITLLIIILLACTVLPKPFRKWFWSLVGAAVITLIIWVLLPEKQDDWRPFTFDKELAALEARYAIPDNENAAVIYQQLLDSNHDMNEPNDFRDLRNKSLSSKDYPQIALWLTSQQPTIKKLTEASRFEKCHFPIVVDVFELNQTMNHLSHMRHRAKLLIIAANNDLGDGRTEQAIEKAHAVLQMAKYQYQQPTIIDMLTGLSIEAFATNWLKNFIVTENVTEKHLNVIEGWLREIRFNWNSDWPAILDTEKLLYKNTLSFFYATNSKGRIRFNSNPMAFIKTPIDIPPELNCWMRKLFKLHTVLYWFYMPSTPQKAGEIIDTSYEKYYAMAKSDFDWKKEPKEIPVTSLFSRQTEFNYPYMTKVMADMMAAGHYKIHDTYLRYTTDQKGSLILIALKRYKNEFGNWPENLNKIKSLAPAETFIDSLNGGSFVYKITGDGFTLYSKGKNNIDENGKLDWGDNGADDWLIWPQLHRAKIKKGKVNEQQ